MTDRAEILRMAKLFAERDEKSVEEWNSAAAYRYMSIEDRIALMDARLKDVCGLVVWLMRSLSEAPNEQNGCEQNVPAQGFEEAGKP